MCGIAGWVDFKDSQANPQLLRSMTRALHHRGPDGEGYYEDELARLGHRRLKIIDLSTGDQPISNEDGTVWIVFNGEIYNFQELRQDLLQRGHQFRTKSDTESIVHLYEEHGADCVRYLRGQFAFAVWDTRRQQLLLARDRLGQKPLYYCHQGSCLLFGSELTSLLEHPRVSTEIDLVGLDAYMAYGYVPEPLTILQGVHKLHPAHTMLVTADGLKTDCYWQPAFDQPLFRSWRLGKRWPRSWRLRLRPRSPADTVTAISDIALRISA